VCWIDATPHAAEMIELKACGNRAYQHFVNDAMGDLVSTVEADIPIIPAGWSP